jgi:hypothetical protein
MSFGFSVVRDEMTEDETKDTPLRTLREVELFDVSPVTFPAYSGTDGGLRAAFDQVKASVQFLGLPLALGPAQTRDLIRAAEPSTPAAMRSHMIGAHGMSASEVDGMSMPDMQDKHGQMHAGDGADHSHKGMASALVDQILAIDDISADPERIRVAIDALSALLAHDDAPLPTEHPSDRSLPPLDHFKRVLDLNRRQEVA